MQAATTLKFYFDHTKQQSSYPLYATLWSKLSATNNQQSEQEYGQYDLIVSPNAAPFLNYSLVSSLLADTGSFKYHAPRIHYNETESILYPTICDEYFKTHYFDCNMDGFIDNDTLCEQDKITSASIWLIDFEKEQQMELGRSFDEAYIPQYGQVILADSMANALGVENIGEMIYISLPINSSGIPLLSNYLNDHYFNNISMERPDLLQLIEDCHSVIMPVNVSYISEVSLGGKFAEKSSKFDAVMNIKYFMQIFMENLPPVLSKSIDNLDDDGIINRDHIEYDSHAIYDYVTEIYMNLPPNRITPYMSTNYNSILSTLVNFAGKIRYKIGWKSVGMELDILESMALVSYTVLSLSIVLDMIVFVLIILSIGLLYSLLVISVDSKKFMLGILRMLGMSKKSLVYLLVSQSLGYSIPAYATGMILAQLGVIYCVGVLGSAGNVTLDKALSSNAIIIATTVGIGCSLAAAIFPIISALHQNLRDVLDVRHSQTKAVKFNIDRSNNFGMFSWNAIVICTVMVLFGWFIYYFLPQAFLSGDLAQLAIMLFSLMLAMLFGFVLMGINMQHIVERIVVKILLFWEKRPIPGIVIKNLIAHRIRNRKTATMYSLSLSFIFLVTVMVGSNVQFMKVSQLRRKGQRLVCTISEDVSGDYYGKAVDDKERGEEDNNPSADTEQSEYDDFPFGIQDFENFVTGSGNWSDAHENVTIHQFIEDFAWRPFSIRKDHHYADEIVDYVSVSNIGKTFEDEGMLFPVVTNFEDMSPQSFIKRANGFDTSLTGSELLYSAMGSQRLLVGDSAAQFLKLKSLEDKFLLKFTEYESSGNFYKLFKSAGWYSLYSHYNLLEMRWGDDWLMSISAMPRNFKGVESVEDLWMWRMFIKLKPSVVSSEISYIKDKLSTYCQKVWDYNEFAKETEDSVNMLDLIFSMNTYMALFLCLFSLIASMSTNIIEQTKEIGIFRSMGLTKYEINKIYVYEALILILSSSLIGMIIGSVLSFVVLQQQTLFTNYAVDFYVPQSVIGAAITGAIGTSILSVWFPLKRLNQKQIAQNMRESL